MKLRNRINLYTTVLFIVLLMVLNVVIYMSFKQMILNSEMKRTTAEAEQTIKGINDSDMDIPIVQLLRSYVPVNGMLQIVKQDGTREAAVTGPNQQELHEVPITFYQEEVREIIEYDGIPYAFVSIPIIWHSGEIVEVQIIENLQATADMLGTLRIIIIIVTVVATVPVMISSRLLSNFISRPLTRMMGTMRDIQTSGQFKRITLPDQSKDELYQMGETFNKMMDLLEINYEKQGQFVSNASHELKTPLTIIESYASLLKRRGKDQPVLFDEAVQAIHSEALRMKDLTQQLLLFAKYDEGWNVELENLQLNKVVEEMVRTYQKSFQRDVQLKLADEAISVRADLQKLKQLFYIIIDNARKYSEDVIEVHIKKYEKRAVIEIRDKGIGIPQAELDQVFERFYRVDKARTRKTGGFGLGLSIAKEIAEAMNAQLEIESMEGYGTVVKIALPQSTSQ